MVSECRKFMCGICGKEYDTEGQAKICEKFGKEKIYPIGTVFSRGTDEMCTIVDTPYKKGHINQYRFLRIRCYRDKDLRIEEVFDDTSSLFAPKLEIEDHRILFEITKFMLSILYENIEPKLFE